MRFIPLILLLFIFITPTFGQTPVNVDSLERVFEAMPPAKKIKAANTLMQHYIDVSFEKTDYYARQAFQLAKANAVPPDDVAYTHVSWGIIQYDRGNYDSSLIYNYQALRYYKSVSDTTKMAVTFNNISLAYNAQGDFAKAAEYAYKALSIYIKYERWRKAGIASLNLGSSYFEAREYSLALYWAQQAYAYYTKANDSSELPYALQAMVDVYVVRKEIDSAQQCLKQIAQFNAISPNEYLEAINLSQRGEVYMLQEKYDSARIVQEQCIRFYEQLGIPESVQQTRISLARTWLALGNVTAAHQQAEVVLAIAHKVRKKRLIMESCLVLANVYKAKNNLKQALHFMEQAALYKDSILFQSLHGSIEGKLSDIKLEQEVLEKARVLDELNQHTKLISRQWLVIIVIAVALIVMAMLAFFIRRVSEYRKRMNQQLVSSNTRLNALNEEVNGLVNTIVHDLNAPLNSVRGIFNLLASMPHTNDQVNELIALGQTSVTAGQDVVRQLLELREVESGMQHKQQLELHAGEVLLELHKMFSMQADQKQLAFVCEAADFTFVSDKISLQRILTNLISNAIKFSHAGGVVAVSAVQLNGSVSFSVSDQGQGFTHEDQKKIYGKFQKLSARPTAGEASNGLGLATVNLLVQHLQGTISLQSQPGKGSTFTVTLPG
jgi:signal transduction histidine kinase